MNDELNELIDKIAASVAASYPGYVSAGDLAQEMWAHYLSKPSMSTLVGCEGWEKALGATLKKVAYSYAAGEEAAVHGYEPEDVYHYSIPVIRVLLEDAFTYEDWQSFAVKGDGQPHAKGQVNETGDRMAMLADVKQAWEALSPEQNSLIFDYYKHAHNFERLGILYNITPGAARSRLDRAVKALQRQLGRKSPADMRQGFSGRRVGSTAASLSAVDRDWNG